MSSMPIDFKKVRLPRAVDLTHQYNSIVVLICFNPTAMAGALYLFACSIEMHRRNPSFVDIRSAP